MIGNVVNGSQVLGLSQTRESVALGVLQGLAWFCFKTLHIPCPLVPLETLLRENLSIDLLRGVVAESDLRDPPFEK
jgi:hypothetical protein